MLPVILAACAAAAAARGHASAHVLDPQDELLASRQELANVRAELAAARAELHSVRESVSLAVEHKSQIALKGPQKVFDDALGKFHLFPALAGTFRLGVFEHLQHGNQTFDEMRLALNVSAKGFDALLDFLVTSGLVTYDKFTGSFANHPDLAKMNLTDFKTQVMGFAVSTQASARPALRVHDATAGAAQRALGAGGARTPYRRRNPAATVSRRAPLCYGAQASRLLSASRLRPRPQRQFYYIAESVREGRAVGLTNVLGDYESLYEARAHIPEIAQYWVSAEAFGPASPLWWPPEPWRLGSWPAESCCRRRGLPVAGSVDAAEGSVTRATSVAESVTPVTSVAGSVDAAAGQRLQVPDGDEAPVQHARRAREKFACDDGRGAEAVSRQAARLVRQPGGQRHADGWPRLESQRDRARPADAVCEGQGRHRAGAAARRRGSAACGRRVAVCGRRVAAGGWGSG